MNKQSFLNLRIKKAKLTACAINLFYLNEKYRGYIEGEKEVYDQKNARFRTKNLLTFWGIVLVLFLVRTLTGIGDILYHTLYFTNWFIFVSCLVGSMIKGHKKKETYDKELMDSLLNMIHISSTILALQNTLDSRYQKMIDELTEEEKVEVENYLKEHEDEIESIASKKYDIDEIHDMIREVVTDDDDNAFYYDEDKSGEYEQATSEYMEYVNGIMLNYLITDHVDELKDEKNKAYERKL